MGAWRDIAVHAHQRVHRYLSTCLHNRYGASQCRPTEIRPTCRIRFCRNPPPPPMTDPFAARHFVAPLTLTPSRFAVSLSMISTA